MIGREECFCFLCILSARGDDGWMDRWDGQAVVVMVAIEMHCGYGIWDVGGGCASREDDGKKMLS